MSQAELSEAGLAPAGVGRGGWSRAQRRLHWWVALLVPLTLALGFLMVELPLRPLAPKFLAYQAHKSFGLVVFGLVAWRLVLRWRRGRPVADAGLPRWQVRAAGMVHAVLYGLLLMVPVLGYLSAASAPGQVPTMIFLLVPVPHVVGPDAARFALLRLVHLWLAVGLVALALGHALMALRHHAQGRPVLRAMWRGDA